MSLGCGSPIARANDLLGQSFNLLCRFSSPMAAGTIAACPLELAFQDHHTARIRPGEGHLAWQTSDLGVRTLRDSAGNPGAFGLTWLRVDLRRFR